MAALISLVVIITMSYLVVRAGAVALMLTGLSAEAAGFQAQSAFMGVGFTTQESESVVSHPVRRRVVQFLMLVGFAAMASVFASVFVAFSPSNKEEWDENAALILGSLLILFLLISLGVVRNTLTRLLEYTLTKSGAVELHDYEELLRVDKGYSIAHLLIERDSWMADKTLRELRLTDEGVIVLNIIRGAGVTLATPGAETRLDAGDKLLCYGLEHDLSTLSSRPADYKGQSEHKIASQLHLARRTAEETVDHELAEVAETVKELDEQATNPGEPE